MIDSASCSLRYDEESQEKIIVFDEVKNDDVNKVTDFVGELLDAVDCPLKAKIQLSIALDEIISNIVKYAYKNTSGSLILRVVVNNHSAAITFEDNGSEYNPLIQADPDITLSAEEREIGGLGLFMVKQTMSDLLYEYKDGKNILKIIKEF